MGRLVEAPGGRTYWTKIFEDSFAFPGSTCHTCINGEGRGTGHQTSLPHASNLTIS
jgi:hypothetical protein